ncbi:hypothetical protein ACIXNI_19985 [Bacteroides fragilis]
MNVQLHPDIDSLDKESLCYSIYSQLYHNFFNAQQKRMMTILTVSRKGTRPA